MPDHEATTEPAPPRFSVQVCMSPDPDPGPLGYIGYVPESDTEVRATTYEGARVRAIQAHMQHRHADDPHADAGPLWKCLDGHENPAGSSGCDMCGTLRL